jgi:hypothetical protein
MSSWDKRRCTIGNLPAKITSKRAIANARRTHSTTWGVLSDPKSTKAIPRSGWSKTMPTREGSDVPTAPRASATSRSTSQRGPSRSTARVNEA